MSLSIPKSRSFLTIATFALALAFVGGVFAQSGTSTISGSVTDQTGAAVPGATVTAINPANGSKRSTVTSSQGNYTMPGLSPATYRLEVESPNFKKSINRNVQALVDSTARIDIVLEPGEVSIEVDVTTNTIESVVNTQDASIGNNFVPEQITQLPTNLRRVNDLLSLQPGVTREGYVAGGRSDQSNITLDGVDINDQQTGGRSGQFDVSQGSVLRATTESVEEFRITTSNANANQGRSSGAQISLVTKSGTNDWHGAGFYFYRPTAFSANDFFNNAAGSYTAFDQAVIDGNAAAGEQKAPRPSLARDLFGGAFGGPIKRDKFFFFYSYEGQRQTLGDPVTRTVPLANLGQGTLRFEGTGPGCTNGMCTLTQAQLNVIYNQVGINQAAVNVLQGAASRYPSNVSNFSDDVNVGAFRFNVPTTDSENTHIARLDYVISDAQNLFFRANYQWDNTQGGSALQRFPDSPAGGFWSHPTGFVVGHTWTIGANKINNFRYGFTRQAFSTQGDSADNSISFRFVYSPVNYARTLNRVSPVTNITDDFTWITGNHTVQLGGNVRIIRNRRNSFAGAFDTASGNPSFYDQSGGVLITPLTNAGYTVNGTAAAQAGITALIGRYSQYSGNFTFDLDGSVVSAGSPSNRNFATEEYDGYIQDVWRPIQNLTITAGLRYSLSRPVYEQNGFQVVPAQRLGTYFDRRRESSAQGVPYNELISFERAGPANNGQGFYSLDKNNFQPKIAFAWSPSFESGFLHALFGDEGDSTIRGGFAITNDYFGGQLAVSFDGLSTIGFTSSSGISANTYNVTDRPAPPFTGFGQVIRTLPGIPAPTQRFATDVTQACLDGTEECPQRIETSLDGTIVSPINYQWSLSYGRSLPKGMYMEASYIGRKARNLFSSRDIMALNNLVDPQTGMDWYTAVGILVDARDRNVPVANIAVVPYFENLFPGFQGFFGPGTNSATQELYRIIARGGFDFIDYTFVQTFMDDSGIYPNMFYHPQYAAFSAYGTTAYSDYHGGTFSLRQRLGETLTYDFNYTYSKSMDNASGLQAGDNSNTGYGSAFILNPLRPDDNYSVSDFDTKHIINANFIFQLPIGKGRAVGTDMNSFADAVLGGWQLAGIYRWNSGLPITAPFDGQQWATNWNAQSNGVRRQAIATTINRDNQNIFVDRLAALNSFRNARPGETGDRNIFRDSSYQSVDLGLSKNFKMPWKEGHKVQLRWEVFNVLNEQFFQAGNFSRSSWGLGQDPELATSAGSFGNVFNSIQGSPRSMQFGVRYSF